MMNAPLPRRAVRRGALVGVLALWLVAPAAAQTASVDECIGLGDDLVAATEDSRTLEIANQIMAQCDAAALLSLTHHFNGLGRTNLAVATATACTEQDHAAFDCWILRAALHVKLRQLEEAEMAATIAQTLAGGDPDRQNMARRVYELVRDAMRARDIFGG
jgi:hypothetical protein